ncbi:topoisomerase DNA-binding C4 zinc finger domain-containing protein [Rhodovulum sulfidophilum]|uniref:topoisomerase DNA-binding C4 zinc finger domain-containing protein n=1 Tax=Rhodovulum sulfidophilum TaxID=35806 RepID=UPI001921EA17|nr:topoisomerase DNA-binding C4 zinc finger domain-containing protein [Rhodovulum sulfidophilum]MBL3575983.1 topoisomerase DNA-binding C4 zinc finger domain-containing protein [Rhodovulum sulfidophilum]
MGERRCQLVRPACGTGLPVRKEPKGEKICGECGAVQEPCPECTDGWLVERKGRYGTFLGCVRFPDCTGKSKKERQVGKRTSGELDAGKRQRPLGKPGRR